MSVNLSELTPFSALEDSFDYFLGISELVENENEFDLFDRPVGLEIENKLVKGNYAYILQIPFIISKEDKYPKKFLFEKDFNGVYNVKMGDGEFLLVGMEFGSPMIEGLWYDKKRTKINDPKIKSGGALLILGMGLSYFLGVRKLSLSDMALIYCDENYETFIGLSLLKILGGGLGFYEKYGFKGSRNISIYRKMLKNVRMPLLMEALGLEWDDGDIKVTEYLNSFKDDYLTNENFNVQVCKDVSVLIGVASSIEGSYLTNDETHQVLEALARINDYNQELQFKRITIEDYKNMLKL
jgi:hypothetical protein